MYIDVFFRWISQNSYISIWRVSRMKRKNCNKTFALDEPFRARGDDYAIFLISWFPVKWTTTNFISFTSKSQVKLSLILTCFGMIDATVTYHIKRPEKQHSPEPGKHMQQLPLQPVTSMLISALGTTHAQSNRMVYSGFKPYFSL